MQVTSQGTRAASEAAPGKAADGALALPEGTLSC